MGGVFGSAVKGLFQEGGVGAAAPKLKTPCSQVFTFKALAGVKGGRGVAETIDAMIDAIADVLATNRGNFRRAVQEEAGRRRERKEGKEGKGETKVTDAQGFLNEEGRRCVLAAGKRWFSVMLYNASRSPALCARTASRW